jgi:hypothetical protein
MFASHLIWTAVWARAYFSARGVPTHGDEDIPGVGEIEDVPGQGASGQPLT